MSEGADLIEPVIESLVRDLFKDLGLPRPPHIGEDLRDAGLTSLQLVDLVFLVEDRCAVSMPDTEINPQNFRSIKSIAEMVARLRNAPAES
jgi:acyl carrier protein